MVSTGIRRENIYSALCASSLAGVEIMSFYVRASVCCQASSVLSGAADHHPAPGFN